LAAAVGRARRLHLLRIPSQQRLHLAALLIASAALPLCAQSDIDFRNQITPADFAKFSHIVGQGIFPTPVQPARAAGFLGFDVGIAASAVQIDKAATYWTRAVGHDFSTGGYVGVPRLVASKGFGAGTLSASYAKLGDSGIKTWGGSLDVPLIRGTIATPEIALRASYATLTGSDVYKQKVYGVEAFISKGFGPVMPYAAVGRMHSNATGTILLPVSHTISEGSNINRYTAGVRFSLLLPRIGIEVTKAEVTSYAAKISFGF
jgi:hypothetical protein